MKVCVDVYYTNDIAMASGAVFDEWTTEDAIADEFFIAKDVQPYEPGQFYKRELPPLSGLINQLNYDLDVIVIDGFVWLDDANSPGLGSYLFEEFDQKIAVIGVAKSRFRKSSIAVEVMRGSSLRPLFVTAVGMDQSEAAERIRDMHGNFRMPTLLKRADRFGRDKAEELASAVSSTNDSRTL